MLSMLDGFTLLEGSGCGMPDPPPPHPLISKHSVPAAANAPSARIIIRVDSGCGRNSTSASCERGVTAGWRAAWGLSRSAKNGGPHVERIVAFLVRAEFERFVAAKP